MESIKENIGFEDSNVKIFWPKHTVGFRHFLGNNTFKLVLPDKIYIPISITALTGKLFIFHPAIKLFSEHFEGKIFLCALSLKIAEFQKLLYIWELLAEK